MRWEGQEKAELGQHLLRIYCVFRPAPGLRGPLLLCAALRGVGTSPHVKWAGQQGLGQRPDSRPARKQTASQCQGSATEWPPPFPGECLKGLGPPPENQTFIPPVSQVELTCYKVVETTCQFNPIGLDWDLGPDPGGVEEGGQEEWGQFSYQNTWETKSFCHWQGNCIPARARV